ncbi:MAG: hypothetical protein ACLUKK_07210 [Lacrimispora saccharolytica]
MLEFPKPVMKMAELTDMGIPKEYLLKAYRDRNQTFATKIDPTKRNSPIIFDTDGFKKWWLRQIDAQTRGMGRR